MAHRATTERLDTPQCSAVLRIIPLLAYLPKLEGAFQYPHRFETRPLLTENERVQAAHVDLYSYMLMTTWAGSQQTMLSLPPRLNLHLQAFACRARIIIARCHSVWRSRSPRTSQAPAYAPRHAPTKCPAFFASSCPRAYHIWSSEAAGEVSRTSFDASQIVVASEATCASDDR